MFFFIFTRTFEVRKINTTYINRPHHRLQYIQHCTGNTSQDLGFLQGDMLSIYTVAWKLKKKIKLFYRGEIINLAHLFHKPGGQ